MTVTLKWHTPLNICSDAIRTCWQSQEKSDTNEMIKNAVWLVTEDITIEDFKAKWGYNPFKERTPECGPKDKALIDRVGNQNKHSSTLEHITYNFKIEGISRALLQELARHRLASLSVKSTRYTLKELKEELSFYTPLSPVFNAKKDKGSPWHFERASKYLVLTGVDMVDEMSIYALENLRLVLLEGISNDKAKYCLPESYKTELAWSINARSLQNFLALRTSKAALWEIRDLANTIYDILPDDHKYLFEACLYKEGQ